MDLFMKALYLLLDDEHGIPVAAWDALFWVAVGADHHDQWRVLDREARIVDGRVVLPPDSMVRVWIADKLDR